MANDTMLGALGGAGMGARIGSMIPLPIPGLGTALGAFAGAGLGMLSMGKNAKNLDKAMLAIQAIPKVDPNMLEFKDQLTAERKAVASGFSTEFQVAKDIIAESEAGGMNVASEMAKTNPALALIMMNQVSNQADTSINKALGTISTQKMGYTQLMAEYVDKISQRELQLSLLPAVQQMATATANMKDTRANLMGGVTQLLSPEVTTGISDLIKSSSIFKGKLGNAIDPLTGLDKTIPIS